jgi:Outer membrane protein beta-barrel domain
MKAKTLLASVLLACAAAPSFAGDIVKAVFGITATGGGEKLVTVSFTDGSSENIKSGGLVQLFGGAEFNPLDMLTIQATVGYHVDDTNARNASVKFTRVPLELIAFWKPNDYFRLGGGLRKANGAKVSGSGDASDLGTTKLESKLGGVLQGEYLFSANASMFVRFVAETYSVKGGPDVSGNHGGLGISFRF